MSSASPVHFISGLPRSGSTLLAALLRQNPQITAHGRISPVAPMVIRLTSLMAEGDYAADFSQGQRMRLLRGIVENFYNRQTGQVIVDTSREWCTRLALIASLYPRAKVVCCVRDPVWIVDSLERMIVRDPILSSRIVPMARRGTQHDRLDHLLSREGVFGYAWRVLTEAFHGPFADRLVLVDYLALATQPSRTLERLAQTLDLPPFPYDPNHVENAGADTFDAALGTPDLHRVRPKVTFQERNCILPPEVIARLKGGMFWRDVSVAHRAKAHIIA